MTFSQLISYGVLYTSSKEGGIASTAYNRLEPLEGSPALAPSAWAPDSSVCGPKGGSIPTAPYLERHIPVSAKRLCSRQLQ